MKKTLKLAWGVIRRPVSTFRSLARFLKPAQKLDKSFLCSIIETVSDKEVKNMEAENVLDLGETSLSLSLSLSL